MLDSLPLDSSPALLRVLRSYSPLKSLQTLAADADLTLAQVSFLTKVSSLLIVKLHENSWMNEMHKKQPKEKTQSFWGHSLIPYRCSFPSQRDHTKIMNSVVDESALGFRE